jgi:hypothetical protein
MEDGKTIMVAPCWLDEPSRIERNLKWLRYHLNIREELGFDQIVLFDNCSQEENIRQVVIDPRVNIFRALEHLPRTGIWEYPYCWRMMKYVQDMVAERGIVTFTKKDLFPVKKVIFLDTDFYVLTPKFAKYIANLGHGYTSFWCPKYGFPEAALNVLCEDAFSRFLHLPIPSPTYYNGKHMEWILPFTQVNKDFVGDRYGEGCEIQREEMDWYGQWNTGCADMIYDLKSIKDQMDVKTDGIQTQT